MKLSNAKDAFLLNYFAEKKHARKTLVAYEADLQQFCDFAGANSPLTSITKQLVSRWLTQLRRENYSSATLYRKMAALRVFCSYWVRKNKMPESPFWRINSLSFANPPKQQPQTITSRNLSKLLTQARRNVKTAERVPTRKRTPKNLRDDASFDTYRAQRDLAIIESFRATGLRISELAALNINQLSIQKKIVTIKVPKSTQPRHVQILFKSSLSTLEEYLKLRKSIGTNNALFLNAAGLRLSVQGITNILKRLCQQAALKPITPTMFRNTVEKLLLDKGVDLRVVLSYLGKSSITPTSNTPPITTEHILQELKKAQN
jgi:site-specific recombinase XerD